MQWEEQTTDPKTLVFALCLGGELSPEFSFQTAFSDLEKSKAWLTLDLLKYEILSQISLLASV